MDAVPNVGQIQTLPLHQPVTAAEQYLAVRRLLSEHYPPRLVTALTYVSPFQLVVAAILAVQSDEAAVNRVTAALFEQYPDAERLESADKRTLARLIQPTTFHRRKAKHLKLVCQMLLTKHGGRVPLDLIALTKLPGISRRSAYFILEELTGESVGIIVDARVWRVAERLGLVAGSSAEAIEHQLVEIIPHTDWQTIHALFTQHADRYCTVQKPHCTRCPLNTLCAHVVTP